jgi:hypothetical protein
MARTNPRGDEERPSQQSPKPVDSFSDGSVQVSIWENQSAKGAFRVATLQLRYKDGDDWKTALSYGANDLLHLEAAAREARDRITAWTSSQKPRRAPHA